MSSQRTASALRQTVAQHGELRSPSAGGQLAKMISAGLAAVLVAAVAVGAWFTLDSFSSYTANAVDIGGQAPPPNIGDIKGGVNILLAGTDQCEPAYAQYFGDRCADGAEEADGVRSDVNLVMHISDEPRRVTVMSFPRDLMIPIPSCTDANGDATSAMSKEMLNTAIYYGGLGCTVNTLEQLTGLDIQYAASINWGGVIEMTNAVGGVPVCLAAGIKDPDTGIDWAAGEHTIQGIDALQFLRTRHGVGNGGDLGRISNQQQYMSNLVKKMMSEEVLSNPATVLKLARTALSSIDPSTSLTDPAVLLQIANAVRSVPFEDIAFVGYPTLVDPDNPNRVVPDEEAAAALMSALTNNQQLVLTGGAGVGVVAAGQAANDDGSDTQINADGTVAADGETAAAGDAPAEGATDAAAPTSTAPAGTALLPSDIKGQTAAQSTCSNGNQRG